MNIYVCAYILVLLALLKLLRELNIVSCVNKSTHSSLVKAPNLWTNIDQKVREDEKILLIRNLSVTLIQSVNNVKSNVFQSILTK